MGEIRTLGPKAEEEKSSDGTGQPEKNTSLSDIDAELDKIVVGDDDIEHEEDEDNVILSKDQFEKLKKERDDFKAGLLSTKEKLKGIKNPPAKTQDQTEKSEVDDSPMTKKDLFHQNEKMAVDEITSDAYNDEHYGEIVKFYNLPKTVGVPTVKELKEAWEDAKVAFIRRNPDKAPTEDKDKEAGSQLGSERQGLSGGKSAGGTKVERKTILPKTQNIKEWY